MTEENKKDKGRWERLKDPYRLIIRNEETLMETGSYQLTLLNVYILLSALVVIVATIVVLAIAFTPIKRLIPGYPSSDRQAEMLQLYRDLDSLEQIASAQQRYNEGIRRMLIGEVEYAPENPPETEDYELNMEPVERIQEDEMLRQEVEMEKIRDVTGNTPGASSTSGSSPRDIPLEQMYITTPISGSISMKFDPEKDHIGVDVVAPRNTPIKAALDGWVITSDWTLETGNTIAIQHPNNIVTFYKHNSELLKKVGDYVRAGEAIAIIGNTGELTDGPHLHFELWHRGKPVNPENFVTFR